MDRELDEARRTEYHQIEKKINKNTEILKRNQIEILDLKITVTEMKNHYGDPEACLSRQKN